MIRWTTAFIDLPATDLDETTTFWEGVTGFTRSATRGTAGEFASLMPADGDPYLGVQRTGDEHSRIHIDLHVDDIAAYADRAIELGATETDRGDFVAMHSPGGLPFCFVTHQASALAASAQWPTGGASRVNQVCIDIPAARWSAETEFWSALTGWPYKPLTNEDFRLLHADDQFALRMLMQRDSRLRRVAAHLDVGASDRDREVIRHIELGAAEIEELDGWTRMIDPSGMPYCVTDRDPISGRMR